MFYSLKASFLFYYLTTAFWWALLKLFSDMKCKIFDFLRSTLHNLYRYVDFMFAKLTTMTHYLGFQRLLKSAESWKDIYDPIICLRYLLMSMCLQYLNCHCYCTKAVQGLQATNWGFQRSYLCVWLVANQGRVEDMAISKDKEPLRTEGQSAGRGNVWLAGSTMAPVLP